MRLIVCFLFVLLSMACRINLFNSGERELVPVKEIAIFLDDSLRQPQIRNSEIGIFTPVDLNDFEKSTAFGRYLQERISAELFSLGYRLIELRSIKTPPLFSAEGELILSRFDELVNREPASKLKTYIYGTYLVMKNEILLTFRIIEKESAQIKGTSQLLIKRSAGIDYLLGKEDEIETRNSVSVRERI